MLQPQFTRAGRDWVQTVSFRCLLCSVDAKVHSLIKCAKPLRSPKSLASLETQGLFLQLSAAPASSLKCQKKPPCHTQGRDRWVFCPQCGQSLKLKGPDSAEAAVFEVDSFKIAFFFYFRNIWGYFAVMLFRNNIFCMDMKKTWDKSPPVDVVCCWDLFPALINQQSDLDLCSALPLISLHFLLQILSCNLKMTLFLSPTILCIFSFNCLPFGEVWCSTWIMDEQSFPPSLIDDGQTVGWVIL